MFVSLNTRYDMQYKPGSEYFLMILLNGNQFESGAYQKKYHCGKQKVKQRIIWYER
jgi:hypothetical protein